MEGPKRGSGRRRSWGRLGKVLAALGIGIVSIGIAGGLYQGMATARDTGTYPPPGQMVDVGGHRLHLQITGEERGLPAVILEAGIGSFSANWAWVQAELAPLTRVIAYDRAGLGWSEPGPPPHDASTSARELHIALQEAGVRPPYVLAGHSYGGLVIRAFVDQYRDEVAGLVLVDASHPDQWSRIPESNGGRLLAIANRVMSTLAWVGFLRIFDPLTPSVATGLPDQQYAEMKAVLALPGNAATVADTLAVWDDLTRPQVSGAQPLGDLPLAVLSVTEQAQYAEVLTALQAELPSLSSNSVHRTVKGATHEGLVSRRENALVVAETVRQVIEAAQTGRPLAP